MSTKQLIERTALELFVAKGIRETTIRDIAAAAKIAEGTLYRHYASKEELAEALFTGSYEALTAELAAIVEAEAGLKPALFAMVAHACRAFDRDPVLFSYLLLSQHRFLRERSNDLPSPSNVLKNAIATAMKRGEIPRRDGELVTAMVLGIVLQAATSQVYGRLEGELAARADDLAAACWRVLGAGE